MHAHPRDAYLSGRHHFYLCTCLAAVALSHGPKKTGKGHRERNREQHQRRREERGEPAYGQSHNDPPVDALTGKRPRRLEPSHEIDCTFAAKYAEKVAQECQAIKRERERYKDTPDDPNAPQRRQSNYVFFGKSTLLKEAIRPAKEGTPHMQFSLGVAGCGKTTFMQEFLMDVYAGKFVTITGPNPSVLLATTTNSQCQALYTLVLALHANEESNVPKPRWVVSQSFWDEAEVTGNDFVRRHATTKVPRPEQGTLVIYTHDSAAERNAGFWFNIVCLDEAGAIAHLQGACIVGLATRMAKIMGDPLQGTLSARSFAAVHALYGRASDLQFATRSLRCPNEIMNIAEPAYRDAFDEDLVISGVPTDERPLSGVIQTTFSHASIDAIRELSSEDLPILGFTNRARSPMHTRLIRQLAWRRLSPSSFSKRRHAVTSVSEDQACPGSD